jgi:hypothetical protein
VKRIGSAGHDEIDTEVVFGVLVGSGGPEGWQVSAGEEG